MGQWDELPSGAGHIARTFPEVWNAYAKLGEACVEAGPLDERTRRFGEAGLGHRDCVGRSRPLPRTPGAGGRTYARGTAPRRAPRHSHNRSAERGEGVGVGRGHPVRHGEAAEVICRSSARLACW